MICEIDAAKYPFYIIFVNFGNALQIEKKNSVCFLNKKYLLQSTPVNIYQFEEKFITRAIIHAYITCFIKF